MRAFSSEMTELFPLLQRCRKGDPAKKALRRPYRKLHAGEQDFCFKVKIMPKRPPLLCTGVGKAEKKGRIDCICFIRTCNNGAFRVYIRMKTKNDLAKRIEMKKEDYPMNKTMYMQQINELLESDESFVTAMVSAEDAEAVQTVFADYGIDLSLDEVETLIARGQKEIQNCLADGELSEESLEDVAGGGRGRCAVRFVASLGIAALYGAACGVCPPLTAGAPAVAVGLTAWCIDGLAK